MSDRRRICQLCDEPGKLYTCGPRCDLHSPATMAGRTVPVPPMPKPRCGICGMPMTVVEPGRSIHPGCGR